MVQKVTDNVVWTIHGLKIRRLSFLITNQEESNPVEVRLLQCRTRQ